jgi:hypothetical protein
MHSSYLPTQSLAMFLNRTVVAVLLLALAIPASAPARQEAARGKAPTGLKAFLLSYSEPTRRNFSRTPSFGWKPVLRAKSYEFQLASASSFRENSIIWSTDTLPAPLTTPDVSVPLALPWVTGKPYSLFARVRAQTQLGMTPWSRSFGFNVRWTQIPAPLPAPNGLLRWTPVDGATAYEIWESNSLDPNSSSIVWWKEHYVATNVTDMRDWFTFHPDWAASIYWRVRAVRMTYGATQNKQTTTTYGAWSPVFRAGATPASTSRLSVDSTVSNVIGTFSRPTTHALMPGFTWTGNSSLDGRPFELYRAYIFSDKDCLNPVYTGSIVGSPAWVPRLSGSLQLPGSASGIATARDTLLPDGTQGASYDALHHAVTSTEVPFGSTSISPGTSGTTSTGQWDLWDRAWPSGAYYWTVVPVEWGVDPVAGTFEYREVELPQDVCAAGRVMTFGRNSQAVPTGYTKAYVTGLSVTGRIRSMAAVGSPRVYGIPLVTWSPALGADGYELQVSRTRYPFQAYGRLYTAATSAYFSDAVDLATSAPVSLTTGTWYYRVRGIDLQMPAGAQGMAWSSVRKVVIAKPVYRVSQRIAAKKKQK